MTERCQTLVIGGGMAGLPLALRAARHGRVAFVEKEKLGGTRLNRGCILTKTMIASAEVAHQVRRAAEFGVRVGDVVVDLPTVVARKDEIADSIRDGSYRAVERAESMDHYSSPRAGRPTPIGSTCSAWNRPGRGSCPWTTRCGSRWRTCGGWAASAVGELFTHTARDDADVVYRTVSRGQDRSIAGRMVPHAVFVDPEVGAVGLTEPGPGPPTPAEGVNAAAGGVHRPAG
ncbi:MAG: FAD-dependent oxidoreductase [Pseudonocardia sp.]